MDEQPDLPATDYTSAYYDPPHVQWWVLLIAFSIAGLAISLSLPNRLAVCAQSFAEEAWGIYLCQWIKRIDPDATSINWLWATVVTDVAAFLLSIPTDRAPMIAFFLLGFRLASMICFVVGIYTIRAELTRHYREKEIFPMVLGPFMTFFFSFIYFQYHLFDISDYKLRERTVMTDN